MSNRFSPAHARRENENAQLDRDGFPPCVMTVAEFKEHLDRTFPGDGFRIVAFRVRGYCPGGTITSRRGEMPGLRANKVQVAACQAAWKRAKRAV
ncbi:MAG TPA: hypothetical protein VEC57_00195 [Candidatus Limnocylindrales bacterium]|nr:hypothetical protein [Candidatus Limnocylindrales bacterium]